MRVSIWQQWASNHSNCFSLVGKFESATAAKRAAQEIRRIMLQVGKLGRERNWFDQPWLDRQAQLDIKQFLALEYNVEFGMFPVWISDNPAELNAIVTHVDNCVFASEYLTVRDDWNAPRPFDTIFEHLGAEVAIHEYTVISVTCDAPDHTIAQMTFELVSIYYYLMLLPRVLNKTQDFVPPWVIHYSPPLFSQVELYRLTRLRRTLAEWAHNHTRQRPLHDDEKQLLHRFDLVVPMRHGARRPYYFYTKCSFASPKIAIIDQSGLTLQFRKLSFVDPGQGLKALLQWLSYLGCANITFSYDGY